MANASFSAWSAKPAQSLSPSAINLFEEEKNANTKQVVPRKSKTFKPKQLQTTSPRKLTSKSSNLPMPAPFGNDLLLLSNTNTYFRRAIYTDQYSQIVLMRLRPDERVTFHKHPEGTQMLFCTAGQGKVSVDLTTFAFVENSLVIVPPGRHHDLVNLSLSEDLHLWTVYSPPIYPANILSKELS